MKFLQLKVFVLVATLLTGGCASIISDNQYPVSVTSAPIGADYTIKNREGYVIQQGKTPDTVTLRSSAGFFRPARYTLNLSKEGYVDKQIELKGRIDGWYFGNLLFGGWPGMLFVDPATGAMWKLPETQAVGMEATAVASAAPANPAEESVSQAQFANNLEGSADAGSVEYEQPAAAPRFREPAEQYTASAPKSYTPVVQQPVREAEPMRLPIERAAVAPKPSAAAPVELADASGPAGHDMAMRVASAHRCSTDIVLEYQVEGGAIYMASCEQGAIKKILCQQNQCRLMD